MDLLSKKLTILAPANDGLGVGDYRRPIETSLEGFTNHCFRGSVIAASASVDLLEYFLTLFHGDALLK